ncbi:unnamed protein product [Prorocentrum cordatum]|uniref:CCHC-type domain-containing protein n=1 Tax=Prorocentrum cordatum TaxID=2364126 RepID=A0ABN9ULE0_9DINO|nr:unnamed protein product [Polarella glacialis]
MTTENEKSETVPSWEGDVASFDSYVTRVHLYVHGIKKDEKGLCGPRLMSKLHGRAWQGVQKYDQMDSLDDVTENATTKLLKGVSQLPRYLKGKSGIPEVLASVQNIYGYQLIQQTLGVQFDKKHEHDSGHKQYQNRWQHRQKNYLAEGDDDDIGATLQEIVDQAGDDEELKMEMLEGAVYAAAQHGQRSFMQARELIRQKKTNRKFFGTKKFVAPGKGSGSQASTRGPPSSASSHHHVKKDKDSWKTDPNTMCLRRGGYGHIAKDCKAPAKLQHGRSPNTNYSDQDTIDQRPNMNYSDQDAITQDPNANCSDEHPRSDHEASPPT